ncbi:hypothetical protein EKO04_006526 [Ascochyta lentis]|uniref:Apple domain-containing protein n=1 Tax=Ascochyta lentis TaxID=205686 RepID=A0A8H7MI97_9PLEO|nr:hypothetical protein EKO04_006526 [Ascochyta lentis]
MRSTTLTSLLAALTLTTAQQINIDAAQDVPVPDLSIDPLATPPAVTYDAASATSSIAAAAAAGETPTIAKRQDNSTCTARTKGAGPVPSTDTAPAFLTYAPFTDFAKNATTPTNYTQAFSNLHASTTAKMYLGLAELSAFDTANCSAQCDAQTGCTSINIFFERSPTQNVASACPNPPSSTLIKCVFWGDAVTTANTVNSGFTDQSFVVAIAGSNGYNKGQAAQDAKKSGSARVEITALGLGMVGLIMAVIL